jgi:hypothetical protein
MSNCNTTEHFCPECNNYAEGDFNTLKNYNDAIQKKYTLVDRTDFDKKFLVKYGKLAQNAYGYLPDLPNYADVKEGYEGSCHDCAAPSSYTSEGNYYQGQSWLPPIPRTAYDKKFMAKYNAIAKKTDYSLLNLWEPYVSMQEYRGIGINGKR